MTAPDENQFALDNDGGAPPRNQNATSHGLHSDPDNLLDYLREHDPEAVEWIAAKYEGYLDSAPFGHDSAKGDQLKQIVVREYSIWQASGLQIREGVVKRQAVETGDGEWIEAEREHEVNQALDRMEKTVTRRLKELGVLDSPDDRLAEAVDGSLENDDYEIIIEDDDSDDEA